ncbi:MAG: PQQ-binding-like beta-propeller repeat protein [Ktedonobacteraceae bacterium]
MIVLVLALTSCAPAAGSATGTGTNQPSQARHIVVSSCGTNRPVPATSLPPQAPQPAVYAGSNGVFGANFSAFDAHNGAIRWCDHIEEAGVTLAKCIRSCPGPPLTFVGKPVISKGILYVCAGAYDSYTLAFDASDGLVRWHTMTDCQGSLSPVEGDYEIPAVENGMVYSGTYALRASDGSVLWRSRLKAAFGPTVMNGIAYAYSDETIYALNATNGKTLWDFQTHEPLGNAPTASSDTVYFGTIGSNSSGACDFFALNASTGSQRWCSHMGGVDGSLAVVSQGVVYIGADALFAFDASTGKLRWHYTVGTTIQSMPEIDGNVVYASADGTYALNATEGTLLWHNSLGYGQATSFKSSVTAYGLVFVVKNDGKGDSIIYALQASNGKVHWQSQTIHQASALTVG